MGTANASNGTANSLRVAGKLREFGKADGKLNADAVVCTRCDKACARGKAIGYSFWSGEERWECVACYTARKLADQEARERRMREGQVIVGLIPAMNKQGIVRETRFGPDEYTSRMVVEMDGHAYVIAVEEKDDLLASVAVD